MGKKSGSGRIGVLGVLTGLIILGSAAPAMADKKPCTESCDLRVGGTVVVDAGPHAQGGS